MRRGHGGPLGRVTRSTMSQPKHRVPASTFLAGGVLRSLMGVLVTLATLAAFVGVARADVVTNQVVASTANDTTSIEPGGSASVTYYVESQSGAVDPENNCNATTTSPVAVTISY